MAIKKWATLVVFFLLAQSIARADEIITTIFNVVESTKTERILVLSGADGRIYKMAKSEANLKYMKSQVGQVVKIHFTSVGKDLVIDQITRPRSWEIDPTTMDLNHFQYNQLRQFAPTDLQTYANAKIVFDSMLNDGDRTRSQCFKRAHIWAYDMWSQMGLVTQKVFIFYTQRYIQLEEFDWWFHVAPMTIVGGKEYVLDGTFMKAPIPLQDWKSAFIKSEKITCPLINHYTEFSQNEWKRLCYLMKVPMYYFSPLDIQNRDLKNIQRNHWFLEELQDARRAFKNYESTYEALDTGRPTITH